MQLLAPDVECKRAPCAAPPTVLCFHAFGGSASQYHPLVLRLESSMRVRPVDLWGHGRRGPWISPRPFTLADEVEPLLSLLPGDGPVHLVGHSYGAAVAMRMAASLGRRVRSMVLYEPASWGLLSRWCPHDAAAQEIVALREDTDARMSAGDVDGAAERFIEYWAGAGQWAATPESRRARIRATMQSLASAWSALFDDHWSAAQLRALTMPCLLMSGTASTAAARRATAVLREALPNARALDFDGLGHLGPITHSRAVDAAVEAFLTETGRPQ